MTNLRLVAGATFDEDEFTKVAECNSNGWDTTFSPDRRRFQEYWGAAYKAPSHRQKYFAPRRGSGCTVMNWDIRWSTLEGAVSITLFTLGENEFKKETT